MKPCPKIHYKIENGEIIIDSCFGMDSKVVIPESIEGMPVTEIAPYGFSVRDEEEKDVLVSITEESLFEEWKKLDTTRIHEIYFPKYLQKIGRYVFYRCLNLKKLVITDSLVDIGAGAFTGCRLRELEIDLYKGEKSCLKTIVDEIRYPLFVTLRYHRSGGETEIARLVFPEYYEEAVENTPARIVETHYHGSGGNYRQCFYNKELNYKEYDALLPVALSQEKEEVVIDLAVNRLMFPYSLSPKANQRYENCLKERIHSAAILFTKREDMQALNMLAERDYWTVTAINEAIDYAVEEQKTEVLGILMDERFRRFPKQKKVFDL